MIYLICPSNYFLMPYVNNYLKILNENNYQYKIIYWNRMKVKENVQNSIVYNDKKYGVNRSIVDYFKYYIFVNKHIKNADKIIIFSPQLIPSIFFKKTDYIIDIRDYHNILKIKYIMKKVKDAVFTVVSSDKFSELLSETKVIVNHNFNDLPVVKKNNNNFKSDFLKIATIGAIRDYEANKNLIDIFKNKENIFIYFHGEGPDKQNLEFYAKQEKISNIKFTGRYDPDNEGILYLNADIINLARSNKSINDQLAIPNRLYKSAFYNKIIITSPDTYLAELVDKYDLGLVLKDDEKYSDLLDKLKDINLNDLSYKQEKFLEKVYEENLYFNENLIKFLRGI